MVTRAAADPNGGRTIHVKVEPRRGERDHQFVGVAEVTTTECRSTACSTAGVPPPKSSLIEQLNEFNLECVKSLIFCTRSLLSGQKFPVHLLQEFLKKSLRHKGLLALTAASKRLGRKNSLLISLILGKTKKQGAGTRRSLRKPTEQKALNRAAILGRLKGESARAGDFPAASYGFGGVATEGVSIALVSDGVPKPGSSL
jgi:hypothetical protein